uniref:DNA 5'-3' helicase n=1 Tax=Rhodymenia pseudopalmata TaxID=31502 RepID=A0A1C9C7S8_RHOPU|nr:replication helicase subunit [Rhodymenia pseudopalmata]AOM64437.1 replication helicase subunit [Rhodymenia pseudopalmata]
MYFHPLPPQNCLEENILLGMILINPTLFSKIIPLIDAKAFFLEENAVIYKHLLNLYKKNRLYTTQLIYSLENNENFNSIGGIEKILSLMKKSQFFTVSINGYRYAEEIIKDMHNNYIKRLMMQYASSITTLAYVKNFPSHKLYNRASNYLDITSSEIPKNSIIDFKELVEQFLSKLNSKTKDLNNVTGRQQDIFKEKISSGFYEIDKLTNGIVNGDLIVVAGRPSMGKTSLAINIVKNICDKMNIGISIFSLEMSKTQILAKLISIASKINTRKILSKTLSEDDFKRINRVCNKLKQSNIYLNDATEISIDYIEYTSKILHKETKYVDVIVVDYLQLIQVEEFNYPTRQQELSYITRKLKLLAQNLYVPLIILSQLNRSIENRLNKEPILSDLRESGCLNKKKLFNIDWINQLSIVNIFENIKKSYQAVIKRVNINLCIEEKANQILKTYIVTQYIYQTEHYVRKNIEATYQHRIHSNSRWIKQYNIIDNDYICKRNTFCKHKEVSEKISIKILKFNKKSTAYDVGCYKNLYFVHENIILHNSIEQDADIVMILHQKETTENKDNKQSEEENSSKTIDVSLCKNRNGPTGVFQMLFSLENTVFSAIKSCK